MQNFISKGKLLPNMIAPAGGVISGVAYLIGSMLVIADTTAAAGAPFTGATEGLFSLPVANVAISEGDKAYWDNTNMVFTNVATGNKLVGAFPYAAAAAAGQSIPVWLSGQVS